MPSKMLSAILLILCTFFSGLIGHYLFSDLPWVIATAIGGLLLGLGSLLLIRLWLKLDAERLIGGMVGMLAAALLGTILNTGIYRSIERAEIALAVYALIMTIMCIIGLQLGASTAKDLKKRVEVKSNPERKISRDP